MKRFFLYSFFLMVAGCKEMPTEKQAPAPNSQASPSGPAATTTSYQRFIFPTKSSPFAESSVALDTKTGQLCKTYPWADKPNAPTGLPVCSLLTVRESDFTGTHKTYMGHTYTFDGVKWNKGSESRVYKKNGSFEPASDDQYDPLGLFAKEEKAKHRLTEEEIRRVATQFGVSYENAWAEAKSQGYQVPPKK